MNREDITSRLFNWLSAIPGVVTSSRTLQGWEDVDPSDQPRLMLVQSRQVPNYQGKGMPARWDFYYEVYIYATTEDLSEDASPTTALNAILDEIENQLQAYTVMLTERPILGLDNVKMARIEGDIVTDEGTLGKQGAVMVPLHLEVTP